MTAEFDTLCQSLSARVSGNNDVRRQLARIILRYVDRGYSECAPGLGGVGWMNYRKPNKPDGVGPHGTRPDAGFDLKAARTGIGAALRKLHSDVLRDEVPDRVAELLRQLDQQKDVDSA
jgi:anti-sigma factor NepR-like protein